MDIYPAIDLRKGRVVRLVQGDYGRETVYGEDPVKTAQSFVAQGAKHLHVVDLDGAKEGRPENYGQIQRLRRETDLFIQVGGGIRDEKIVAGYLEMGINRVILGTVALESPAFLKKMVRQYGEALAVGVDAKEEKVMVSGWQRSSSQNSFDFCRELAEIGVTTVIYTDIGRDGMLQGTNLEAYERLKAIEGLQVIASGGIAREEEITRLKGTVQGAVIGRALYQGKVNLKKAIEMARE